MSRSRSALSKTCLKLIVKKRSVSIVGTKGAYQKPPNLITSFPSPTQFPNPPRKIIHIITSRIPRKVSTIINSPRISSGKLVQRTFEEEPRGVTVYAIQPGNMVWVWVVRC